jgi:hypothetical protein
MNRSSESEPFSVTANEQNTNNPDENGRTGILDEVLENTKKTSQVNGIVVGALKDIDTDSGVPTVDFPMNPTGRPIPARSTVELKHEHIGREVALLFELNDVRKPIVIGLMHAPVNPFTQVSVDNRIHEITAEKELLLRCGEASIHLREDGKIIIKGRDILSRARRTNKVKGGSIQLN